MEPMVSVIIPTYNRPRWLPEAIDSVLAQTYPNLEIIVVNDGSTDNTEEVLSPYMDKIVYLYKENGGPASAVNAGLEVAEGKYISRLDDDDLILERKLELQVKKFEENPSLGLVATDWHEIDENGDIIRTVKVPDFERYGILLTLLLEDIFCQPTVMVKKECHHKVGLYRDGYAQDYDMWIRIARHFPVGVIHQPLAKYRKHSSNRSGRDAIEGVTGSIQSFISEALDSISLEELFPNLKSLSHAYAVRGAILMRHGLYDKAEENFSEAIFVKDVPVHTFWLGILSRWQKKYESALSYFSEIPASSPLYSYAAKSIELTERIKHAEKNTDLTQLRKDSAREYKKLLNITLFCALGEKT